MRLGDAGSPMFIGHLFVLFSDIFVVSAGTASISTSFAALVLLYPGEAMSLVVPREEP